jgi:hypothetical protein
MALRRELARFLALEATRIAGVDMVDRIQENQWRDLTWNRSGRKVSMRRESEIQKWERWEVSIQLRGLNPKGPGGGD